MRGGDWLGLVGAVLPFALSTTLTPGPNTILLTASGATFGFRRTLPHLLGIELGFPAMMVAVGWGLGAVFVAHPALHGVLRWVGAAYLLFLAWKIASARSSDGEGARGRPMTFLQSVAFQWVNPKAWIMSVSAAATFTTPAGDPGRETLVIAAVFACVALPVLPAWALFGVALRRWLSSERALRIFNATMAALLVASLVPLFVAQDESTDAKPVQETASAEVANPMASFARMVPGEWRMSVPAGTSTFDTWHWGPGQHSMRVMTDGAGSGAVAEPWRELQVFYWHPGRKQVCMLGLSPFARGVSEGTIQFEGETAEGVFDLYQTHGLRKLGLRWAFDGPDKYHDILLEATGSAGLVPMNEWDHFRSKGPPAPRPPTVGEAPKLSERLKPLEALLGCTWEAKGDWVTGDAFHIRSTFEWIPYADGIYVRTVALAQDGEPVHVLDAYFFHHTGTDALRCLALSNRGGVYEGDMTALDGGALQLDLRGYEGDHVVPHVVRFDFEKDGTLRDRVWSLEGTDRKLMLDVHHKKVEPKKN